MYNLKKVSCNKDGGCYICEDDLIKNESNGEWEYKNETVNYFLVGSMGIRLCNHHLEELIKETEEFLSKNQ